MPKITLFTLKKRKNRLAFFKRPFMQVNYPLTPMPPVAGGFAPRPPH